MSYTVCISCIKGQLPSHIYEKNTIFNNRIHDNIMDGNVKS